MSAPSLPSRTQQAALIVLRTLVGWHFAWEGFVKLFWPAWSRGGWPLPPWSAAGYLQSATGPFADSYRALGESGWLGVLDVAIALALLLTGLSLMLGLFTQTGAASALALLVVFYLAHVPTHGVIGPGAEGNYLYVNKNLVEAAAVLVLLLFRTGRIAGLDLLLEGRRRVAARSIPDPDAATEAAS